MSCTNPICHYILLLAVALISSVSSTSAQESSQSTPSAPASAPQAAKPLIPDKFRNLRVLPKEIEKADLMPIMKGFCMTFKVRCSHCHVATDDLSSADFASDEKPTKQSARELLRNLTEVHEKYAGEFRPSAK